MTGSHATPTPTATADDRHRSGLALLVIASCQLMVVLDVTIVNIALPHMQKDLGFSTENLSWVVNAYTLTFGGLLLLGGRLGDIATAADDGATFMHFTDPDGNGWAVQEYRRRETEPLHKLLADQAAGNGSNAGDTVG
ncbi:hypothetical protein SBADM41S_03589 [Streptomyces badius]